MQVFGAPDFDGHEQVVFCSDPTAGLRAIIAIHDTNLGPALGGCRIWPYRSEEDALRDVLRGRADRIDVVLGKGQHSGSGDLHERLRVDTRWLCERVTAAGFDIRPVPQPPEVRSTFAQRYYLDPRSVFIERPAPGPCRQAGCSPMLREQREVPMRRRLDFVIPDVDTARKIEDELLLAKIEERYMHFLARDDIDMKDLPRATLAQKMDLEHGIELGLVVGAATGAVLGLMIYVFTDAGLLYGIGTVFVGAILGSIVGAWISGIVASSIPNSRLKKFQDAIEAGHILLMVDVPPERVEEIEALVRRNHPEVEDHGVESLPPVFP